MRERECGWKSEKLSVCWRFYNRRSAILLKVVPATKGGKEGEKNQRIRRRGKRKRKRWRGRGETKVEEVKQRVNKGERQTGQH